MNPHQGHPAGYRRQRHVDKQYRGVPIFQRLGRVSQNQAETWLRDRQAWIDGQREDELRQGHHKLFREVAGKYLIGLKQATDVRSLDTICGHVVLLNRWVGDLRLEDVCNDSFAGFKSDRLKGISHDGTSVRRVKPSTVNRSLEVARTVLNRASRVWRANGKPWLMSNPLIEMLDEEATKRRSFRITWAQQTALLPHLPAHLQRMVMFALNTGARDENICGLRWSWEVKVPDADRSVFLVPAAEFKGKRAHVVILNDIAWKIVEDQRGKHAEFVFVYRRERVTNTDEEPAMGYRRIDTINNTGFQNARKLAGLSMVRVHDFRHTFAQRLRDAGVAEEDRALLLGHAVEGMAQHYATSSVARLVDLANSVNSTRDRMTLSRVVNG